MPILWHRSGTFVDLGMSPLCESYLPAEQLNRMEPFYPLHVWVCAKCFLVQLDDYVAAEHIFTEYAYFSSFSTAWLKHAEDYVAMITDRLGLGPRASWSSSPATTATCCSTSSSAASRASASSPPPTWPRRRVERKGVETLVKFFARRPRSSLPRGGRPIWCSATTCSPRCLTSTTFVAGIAILLKPTGTVTIEFPHLMRLLEGNQFDTIYHEHFCYFSLISGRGDLRGARHDDLRRRGAVDPRRLAAHLRPPRRGRAAAR